MYANAALLLQIFIRISHLVNKALNWRVHISYGSEILENHKRLLNTIYCENISNLNEKQNVLGNETLI